MRYKLLPLFLFCLMAFNSVSAVIMDPSVDYWATGWKLNTRRSTDVPYINMSTWWINIGSEYADNGDLGNITFAHNNQSQHEVIDRNGSCFFGNYTTNVTIDVYATSSWTVHHVYARFITANNVMCLNQTVTDYVVYNATTWRYYYIYNPANTLVAADMGDFDINVSVYAYNATVQYSGYRYFQNCFEVLTVQPPYGMTGVYNVTSHALNFTWTNGVNADATIVVRNNNTFPECPDDGYIVQNNTNHTYNESGVTDTRYYSAFSYNATTHCWSEALELAWGALALSVYNESNASQAIDFDVEIKNSDGTQVYTADTCSNIHFIDYNDIPFGAGSLIKVSNASYDFRLQYADISPGLFNNLTFYLPPLLNPVAPGSGDSGGNFSPPRLYVIQVVNEYNEPIDDVRVTVQRYINTTGAYENLTILYTDAYGQIQANLLPNVLHQIILYKPGYQTKYEDFIPDPDYYGLYYPKTFKLYFNESTFQNETQFSYIVHLSGWLDNDTSSLHVNYTDDWSHTTNTTIQIWMWNHSTNDASLLYTITNTSTSEIHLHYYGVNTSNTFYVRLWVNHTDFGYKSMLLTIWRTNRTTLTTEVTFNSLFVYNFGYNPFGWANFMGFIIVVACMFSFGERNVGVSLLLVGFILLFINYLIGLTAAGTSIPIIFIVFGILTIWHNHRKEAG